MASATPLTENRSAMSSEAAETDESSPPVDPLAGRYDYPGLARVPHERARLGLLMALAAQPRGLLFVELKAQCRLTDGNLNRHLHVLTEAGWIEVWKKASAKLSQTRLILTETGLREFQAYLAHLQQVLNDATKLGIIPQEAHRTPSVGSSASGPPPLPS